MRNTKNWDSTLNVGISLIDNQHKIILDLIGDLGKAAAAKADRKVIDTLIEVIEIYIFRHFDSEEDLLRGQQGADHHFLDHYKFVKELKKYRLIYRNNIDEYKNFAEFLDNMFVDHIKKNDIPMFIVLANEGKEKDTEVQIDDYPFSTEEKRRHKRILRKKITDSDIVVSCYNTSTLKYSRASLIDISLGGVRIQTNERYSPDDLLVLNCVLGRSFKLEAKIRILTAQNGAYGAEFIDLAPKNEKFLMELYGSIALGSNSIAH